ncbi:MAG: alpha-ketoacid dehydrogenase subunit beta, partial [Nitrososphaerales archaeon]
GLVPVLELMFSDFVEVAMDQIANQIARKAYLSCGEEKVGLVIRMASGGGISFGPQHSQSPEAWFAHTPGLITILPSCPRDAKGLLKSAIRSGNPVMFFEHKLLYPVEGPVPEEEELIPIGKADVKSSGGDITLVSAGNSVNYCLEAAAKLKSDNVNAEVVDLRTLYPLDSKAVFDSVEKTGTVLIVEEDVGFCGWGAEVAAEISDNNLYSLKASVKRVAAPYAPIPFSPALEKLYIPGTEKIYSAAKALIQEA